MEASVWVSIRREEDRAKKLLILRIFKSRSLCEMTVWTLVYVFLLPV